MSQYVSEVTDQNFDQVVLQSNIPVLVDFWAVWCQPCRALAPTVEAVAQRYEGRAKVVKLDVDNNQVAQRYGIKGIPTLVLFKGGNEADRAVGTQSKEDISLMLDRALEAEVA